MTVRLETLFRDQAKRALRGIAERLRRGTGYAGGLAAKKVDDGRPIGGGLPRVIETAPITVTKDGWAARLTLITSRFDAGGPNNQATRPIAGYTPAEAQGWLQEIQAECARQITASLRGGA